MPRQLRAGAVKPGLQEGWTGHEEEEEDLIEVLIQTVEKAMKNKWKTTGTTGRSQRTPPSDMMLEIHLKIPDPWISQLLYFILKEKMY